MEATMARRAVLVACLATLGILSLPQCYGARVAYRQSNLAPNTAVQNDGCEKAASVQERAAEGPQSQLSQLHALSKQEYESEAETDGAALSLISINGRAVSAGSMLKPNCNKDKKASESTQGTIESNTHVDMRGLPKHYMNPAAVDPQMKALVSQSTLTRKMATMMTQQMAGFDEEMTKDRKRNKKLRKVDINRWRALRSLEKMQNRAVAGALVGSQQSVDAGEFAANLNGALQAGKAAHGGAGQDAQQASDLGASQAPETPPVPSGEQQAGGESSQSAEQQSGSSES